MSRTSTRVAIGLVLLLAAGACRAVSDEHVIDEPATLEPIEGTETARITVAGSAAERLGIEITEVVETQGQANVPSSALIIDPAGHFWVYTSPADLVFVREPLEDIRQEGLTTFYSEGPRPGTRVVTVGVPELYGFESGIGH
jgi:hypothetical protein